MCALESLDGRSGFELTPTDLEPWPLADLLFLDELYWLTFLAPIADGTTAATPCVACGQRFSPIGA
jgi:hypothetical protein